MSVAPRSAAELPFERAEPLALLHLHPGPDGLRRAAPAHDYAGFGWTELDAVTLSSDHTEPRRVGPALVLALHTPDEATPDAPLELLFELPGDPEPLVVLAPLDRFLSTWLPRLPAAAPHVVLALCNPHGLELPRVSTLGARTLHHAHGDVTSWLDVDEATGTSHVRLHARAWLQR